MSNVIEINDANFESVVLKSEIPVLVDFWAPWIENTVLNLSYPKFQNPDQD